MERDCDKCLWATRSGGCASWNCGFISKNDAYKAWKEKKQEEKNE